MSARLIGLAILAFYVAVGAGIYALLKRKKKDKPQEFHFDVAQVREMVEELAQIMGELQDLDDMLLDLKLCKPGENHRAFRLDWQTNSGKDKTLDMFADGQNVDTKNLYRLAAQRRAELNADILASIEDLYFAVFWGEDGHSPADENE